MKQIVFLFLLTIAMYSCHRQGQEQIPTDSNLQFNIVYGNSKSEQVFSAVRSLDGTYVLAGSINGVSGNQAN